MSYGVVAVLRNGPGHGGIVSTELDALPVRRKYGITLCEQSEGETGERMKVGVMHACGHDLHMTVFLGTAKMLMEEKSHWSGTVVMIAQPAEEMVSGASSDDARGIIRRNSRSRITCWRCTTLRRCPRERWPGTKGRCWPAPIRWTSRFAATEGTARRQRRRRIRS